MAASGKQQQMQVWKEKYTHHFTSGFQKLIDRYSSHPPTQPLWLAIVWNDGRTAYMTAFCITTLYTVASSVRTAHTDLLLPTSLSTNEPRPNDDYSWATGIFDCQKRRSIDYTRVTGLLFYFSESERDTAGQRLSPFSNDSYLSWRRWLVDWVGWNSGTSVA